MSSPDNISLLDIFNLYMGSDKVVVVKNISDDTARDTLESYLAVILNRSLIGVHYPADVSGCCVAVVNRAIRGLWKCCEALLEQPLDGNIIELYAFGQCDGLLIRHPPHQSSDGELKAYLRSDEFTGGAAGEIKEIKRFSCGSGRFAVVLISDISVISRILNRPAQTIKYNLDTDPYFPALHDALQINNQPIQHPLALQTQNQQEAEVSHIGTEVLYTHDSVAPLDHRQGIIPKSLDVPVTYSQQDDDSPRTSQLRIYLDEPASQVGIEESQEEFDDDSPRTSQLRIYLDEPASQVGIEESQEEEFGSGRLGDPTLTDDIETSCIEYNHQHPSNDEINGCETFTERQALDEHQPITSRSPHLQSQLRTDEASAVFAQPRRRLYKKAQELQHGLSEKEAFREALERPVSDASFKQSEQNPQSLQRSRADHRTSQRPSSVDASDNKDRWIKSNATKQDSTCSVRRAAHTRLFLDIGQPASSHSLTSDSPGPLLALWALPGKQREKVNRLVQDSFTKPAVPPISLKHYIRSSSEDRGSSSRSYNQTTGRPATDGSSRPTTGGLYEKILQKRRNVSNKARTEIRDTLRRLRVKSYEDPKTKNFILKGNEDNVRESYTQIQQILLDDTQATETLKAERASRKQEFRTKPEIVIEYMAVKHEPEVPEYWEKFQQGLISHAIESSKLRFDGKHYFKVGLSQSDSVYKAIINLIHNTWDESKLFMALEHGRDAVGLKQLGYKRMRVTKIQRIENLQLYEKYSRKRKNTFLKLHMKNKRNCHPIGKLPESWCQAGTQSFSYGNAMADEVFPQVNEHFCFHGTTENMVDIICDKGFDFRLASQNAMYGLGIYGAETPTKADQYVDPPNQRSKSNRKMFLMRMVLGESFLCTARDPHKYRRPPCANTKHLRDDCLETSHGSFDSVIGQAKRLLFREFVVYESDQCYPEYLISYDRV